MTKVRDIIVSSAVLRKAIRDRVNDNKLSLLHILRAVKQYRFYNMRMHYFNSADPQPGIAKYLSQKAIIDIANELGFDVRIVIVDKADEEFMEQLIEKYHEKNVKYIHHDYKKEYIYSLHDKHKRIARRNKEKKLAEQERKRDNDTGDDRTDNGDE